MNPRLGYGYLFFSACLCASAVRFSCFRTWYKILGSDGLELEANGAQTGSFEHSAQPQPAWLRAGATRFFDDGGALRLRLSERLLEALSLWRAAWVGRIERTLKLFRERLDPLAPCLPARRNESRFDGPPWNGLRNPWD